MPRLLTVRLPGGLSTPAHLGGGRAGIGRTLRRHLRGKNGKQVLQACGRLEQGHAGPWDTRKVQHDGVKELDTPE